MSIISSIYDFFSKDNALFMVGFLRGFDRCSFSLKRWYIVWRSHRYCQSGQSIHVHLHIEPAYRVRYTFWTCGRNIRQYNLWSHLCCSISSRFFSFMGNTFADDPACLKHRCTFVSANIVELAPQISLHVAEHKVNARPSLLRRAVRIILVSVFARTCFISMQRATSIGIGAS